MKRMLLAFFAFCIVGSSLGQSKKNQEVDIIDHSVQLGESVRMISKKYLVDPSEIYKLNKFAVEGISQGMVLKVPVPRKEGAAPKETASTEPVADQVIEPVKNETVADNPATNTDAVKTEATKVSPVTTPTGEIKKIVITERKTEVNHRVVAKETLYSLSRDFNVSVDEIKASNPEVAKNGLKIGQIVIIPTEKSVDIKQSTSVADESPKTVKPTRATTESGSNKPVVQKNTVEPAETNTVKQHKVEPKETLYSLSRKYNVSVEEIKSQNEAILRNGLQIGQVLTIKTHN